MSVEDERLVYTPEAIYRTPKRTDTSRGRRGHRGYSVPRMARKREPFGSMKLLEFSGKLMKFECSCGWTGWSSDGSYGAAGRHAKSCPFSDRPPN